jgi:NAD(P)-dependent dehydrogenase (short-subunit alcohol dehydrogenase family)
MGCTVIITGIFPAKGRAAAKALQKEGYDVIFQPLDVTSDAEVAAIGQFVRKQFGRLDILVNNAGILVDDGKSVLKVRPEIFQHVIDVNTLGALRMCQTFIPLMLRHDFGRVVNVASGRGQLSGEDIAMEGPAYNMSKTAVNALTVMLANVTDGTNVLVNSVCPGWCRTDMGGAKAPRSAKKGAETIVWLATLPNNGPNGGFFRDKRVIPW